MLKLIGVLIMSTELGVAVEIGAGYAEATFPNTAEGVQALIAYTEQRVGQAPDGVRIVVGPVSDDVDESHVAHAFSKLEIPHGFVTPADIRAAVTEHRLPGPSAKAVVLADEKRFGFLYRKKR
jgi:hypothetical protein